MNTQIDFKHLRLVNAVVNQGNLSRAARYLNLTQSALSHQLKNLEQQCQQALFTRNGKKMLLTTAGERLLQSANVILQEADTLAADLQEIAAGTEGTIRLSSECYTSFHWLPSAIEQFEQRFSKIKLKITTPVAADIFELLDEGEIDLAITMYAGPENYLSFPLFNDELVLLVHPENRLADEKTISRAQLSDETLIVYPHGKEKLFQLLFSEAEELPRKVVEMPLTEGILEWCSAGLGVAVMANWATSRYVTERNLVPIPIDTPGTARTWHAVTRQGELPVYLDDFIQTITQNTPSV
ncbi:MAG: LysR family transcriptional regulator [Pseudomonadota bacterium]